MTTATQARQAVRARMEGGNIVYDGDPVPLRWQNEEADSAGDVALPDTPAPFVYTEVLVRRGRLASFGGGRGQNRYRVPIEALSFVFVPKGWGLDDAEAIAEQIAALLRSHRDGDLSIYDATSEPGGDGADIKPKGLESEVGNYFYATMEAHGHFDQIG